MVRDRDQDPPQKTVEHRSRERATFDVYSTYECFDSHLCLFEVLSGKVDNFCVSYR